LCEDHPEEMAVDDKEFSGSLFANLSAADSTVNVLMCVIKVIAVESAVSEQAG
jgi:hypothetical protein